MSRTQLPARKLAGRASALFRAGDKSFVSERVPRLEVTFEGIAGDLHAGATRRSGGREPWYPRGTTIRNERQLSLLSAEELDEIASALQLRELPAEWIGGNMVVEGVPRLTCLPPRTLLFFEGGVTLKIDGDNGPCRLSGRAIAERSPGRPDIELGFVSAARGRRGLVAWVEKPGTIEEGERFEARLPEQRLYD